MPITVRMIGRSRSVTASWLTKVLMGRCTPNQASIDSIQTPPARTMRRPLIVSPDPRSTAKPASSGWLRVTGVFSRIVTPASTKALRKTLPGQVSAGIAIDRAIAGEENLIGQTWLDFAGTLSCNERGSVHRRRAGGPPFPRGSQLRDR